MIDELHNMLGAVRTRLQRVRGRWALAACWLVWAALAWAVGASADRLDFSSHQLAGAIAIGALVTAVVCRALVSRGTGGPHRIAQRIEARHPELGAALLAALEQAPSPQPRRLGYLQTSVIREALSHGRQHNWNRDVPLTLLGLAQVAQLAAFAVLVVACLMIINRGNAVARSTGPGGGPSPAVEAEVGVQPGDAEVERGTPLVVVAEFGGDPPSKAALLIEPTGGASEASAADRVKTLSMSRSFDDPKFVARVPPAREDFRYAVEFSGRLTRQYRVTVFDYPALERADAELVYPEYTHEDRRTLEDVRRVTAVEGTRLTLRCRLNKEVSKAVLVERSGEELTLSPADDGTPVYSATLTLKDSRRYKLHLTDDAGRRNKLPPEFVVNVKPNQAPTLKIASPGRDVRVSPLEELRIAGRASDDFGVLRYGLSYSLGGEQTVELALHDSADGDSVVKQTAASHLIELEALSAAPDQLLSYYVWAEDVGPDGQVRQTMSDMYFAEVRHFEEIFRQGDQPTQQQSEEQQAQQAQGASQQAAELAELQKQIINATWALIRRERGEEPSPAFGEDVDVLSESQRQAVEQLDELAGEVTDQESLAHVANARSRMEDTLSQLATAREPAGRPDLHPALSAERASYQALLKLRAREFSITQSNSQQQGAQSSSASGANSRAQQQLNQLELSAEENRYETQSRAQDQRAEVQEGSEQAREVLDRLRELARRQEDLNERVRQLQSELEAAQSEEEREQIERELKRLREQQREILRDTDELQSEMENSDNAQQTQDQQQKLSETRDRVQRASEALEQGRLSEAVSEGVRAERGLDELQEEFRRRTADRFSEEVRELGRAARQLDERQQRLAEDLTRQEEEAGRSLRDDGARQELLEGLAEQQRQYEELVQQMQETIEDAEEPEPLLARRLYDSVQQANDDRVPETLEVTEQLLEIGVTDQANETMRAANQGVSRLREGVARAAESVLGDQTEALRRADRELQDLEQALNQEISDAQRDEDSSEQNEEPPPSTSRRGESSQGPSQQQQGGGPVSEQDSTEQSQPGGSQAEDPPTQPEANDNPLPGGQGRAGGSAQGDQPGQRRSDPTGGGPAGDLAEFLENLPSGPGGPGGPITGDGYRQWNDRLRDVEDLIDDPGLRAEVARIRDRAEAARADYKRRSKEPDWERMTDLVAEPLAEVRERIREEIRRQESPDSLVPIDRDPVPVEHADTVQEYYQRLGSGE